MKRLFILVLTLILLGCTAIAEDVQVPVFIDGVRVAFFDTEGNFLMQKKADELVYVPLQSFCESLGMNAEVQGQSVSVDGMRIGMFDASGNFLSPKQFDGIDYIPLLPFCEAMALNASENEGKISITREETVQAVSENKEESTGKVALHPYNFGDYFSYDIQERNFQTTQTRVKVGNGYIYNNDTEVDYVLTCNARSSFEIENVSFALSAEVWESDATVSGIKNVGFSEDMPANGSLTKTIHKSGTAFVSGSGWKATKASLKEIKLYRASGYIIVNSNKANAANLASYQKGEEYLAAAKYEEAEIIFEALQQIDYSDSKSKHAEATQKKRQQINEGNEKAIREKEEAYQNAIDLEKNGDYDLALEIFESLGIYKDSSDKVVACKEIIQENNYQEALRLKSNGEYKKAHDLFLILETYKDSVQMIEQCEAFIESEKGSYQDIKGFNGHNLAPIFRNGKWGFIDRIGKLVIPCIYNYAGEFHEGLAVVKNNEGYCYIDENGSIVILCSSNYCGDFSNGLAVSTSIKNGLHQKSGYIDKTGTIVIPLQFDEAFDFNNNGLAIVKKDEKYGCIDRSGNFVIPAIYDSISYCSDNLYAAQKNDRYGLIDHTGNTIVPFQMKYAQILGSTNEKILRAYRRNNGVTMWGMLDTTGKEIHPCNLEYFVISSFHDGLCSVYGKTAGEKKYAWGYINQNGNEVIPCKYQGATDFFEGIAIVQNGETFFNSNSVTYHYGAIDIKGNEIIPCEYRGIIYESGMFYLITEHKLEIVPREKVYPDYNEENSTSINVDNPTEVERVKYQPLKPGSKGQAVLDARMKLYELGYFSKKPTQTEYTNNMKDYVKKFEKDNGLKQDGILSPEDQEVLFSL